MNTDIITLTEIQGTDSVASSRITINENFRKLAKGVGDLQTRIDTSKNTLYVNTIETEAGEFAIKTGYSHTTRFKISNDGVIYIGSMLLDEYIRKVINDTEFVAIDILDSNGNHVSYSKLKSCTEFSNNNIISIKREYLTDSFTAKIKVDKNIIDMYPLAMVYIYDPAYSMSEYIKTSLAEYMEHDMYRFEIGYTYETNQRSVSIQWIPATTIQETYSFVVEN